MYATEEIRRTPSIGGWRRWGAALGLLCIALVAAVVTRPASGDAVDLAGEWAARVDGEPRTITLPGLYSLQGIPAETRVRATRAVTAEHADLALFVESPAYAVTVTWDGVAVGGGGDPSSDDPADRTWRSLVIPLPRSEPGTVHELGLDLRGDFGKGGLTGRLLLGRASEIAALATTFEVQRLAIVLGMSLLGAVPLVVSVRQERPASVAYGAFVTAAAVALLAGSDLVLGWLSDPLGAVRLVLATACAAAALGVAYADAFVGKGSTRPTTAYFAACSALGAATLVVPADWLGGAELLEQLLLLAFVAWYARRVHEAWRERLPGSALLAFGLAVVAWTVAAEIALAQGLRSGSSHLPAAGLAFSVVMGAALAVRDAETSARHERLIRSSLDAMVAVDREGRVENANPEAANLLSALAAGTSLLAAVAETHRPLVRAHLRRASTRPDRCEFESVKGRSLESLATPLGTGHVMLTLRDISVRREMDRAVLQAARLETAGVLVGGIAHDFNNMLSSVLAHVGLLRMQVADPKVRDRLDRMESTVERASELSRRLITVTRGTGSELGALDLHAVCRAAADLAEPTLPSGIELAFEVPADVPAVLGAPGDLEQVLVNLLVNARDALGDRGRIRLCARPFLLRGRAGGVAVMVEDDGPGIPKERREQVFEPFVTDKPTGTGLGLAVARQILRDHHGRVWIEDRPGGGTRFFLALRHVDAVDEAPATLPNRRRILVVEDEPIVLEGQVAVLRDAGYDATGLLDAGEAARWLQSNPLDLLITDVRMPGTSGLDLARQCRLLHPAVPILFVTAFVPDDLPGFDTGTWAALHKPVRPARLVATVGHLRRRAEREAEGAEDVTAVSWSFPALDGLTGATLGFQ
jgi:signal transduction histidine kinase